MCEYDGVKRVSIIQCRATEAEKESRDQDMNTFFNLKNSHSS